MKLFVATTLDMIGSVMEVLEAEGYSFDYF